MSTLEILIQRCRKNMEVSYTGATSCWIACQTAYSESRLEDSLRDLNDTNKFIEMFKFFASKLAVFTKMQQENTMFRETHQEEWMVTTSMQ